MTETLYYLPNARSEQQRQEMMALEAAGICIFCPESYSYNLAEREVLLPFDGGPSLKKQVLLANGTWAILVNEYPYDGTLRHMLLVPQLHVTGMHELPQQHRDGYWEILDAAVKHYGQDGYYVQGIRNGDMRFTGATIAHLHEQFIVGDPDNQGEPVKLYVSSRPPDPPS